jgi:chloride channel protein, CIC family
MTGTLALLVPSMVAVVISYFVTGQKYTIYRSQVPRRSESPAHRGEYNVPLLTKVFVHDAMKVGPVVLSPSDAVSKAQRLMLDKGFRSLPLVDSGKVAGLVMLGDLQRVPADKMGSTPLSEVMTKNPLTTSPDASLLDALEKMTNNRVDRLLVVSKDSGELVGVLTTSDLIRAYQQVAKAMGATEPTPARGKP